MQSSLDERTCYVREKKILQLFTKFYSDSWCAYLYMHWLYECFRRYTAIKYFTLGREKGAKNCSIT